MNEAWPILIPILFTDVVNPVLFAFMVYAAGSRRPIVNSSAVLTGHTLAYFGAGILLTLGLEKISGRLANPRFIDFVISLVVGLLLLWSAYKAGRSDPEQSTPGGGDLSTVKAFGMGAVITFIGVPFALPYFAALDQILKADLSTVESLILLGGYNLLYALPFISVPLIVALYGEQSRPLLQRINYWLDRISGFLMPLLLGLIGLFLVVDAVVFFTTGRGLI